MICYRDTTFCDHWRDCDAAPNCPRPLTARRMLMDLADRVEKASGPDRELDAEIALAVGIVRERDGDCFYGHKNFSVLVLERDYYAHDGNAPELAHLTASLDAALSLVPEGWAWAVYGGAREEIVATAYCVPNGGRLPWPDWVTDICAATPALALCAAALRALASEVGQ